MLINLIRCILRRLRQAPAGKPWMQFAGFVESGDSNSSRNIDEVIYGRKD